MAVLVGALTVPLLGGRLARLAQAELRHGWLLALALALQVLVISVFPEIAEWVAKGLHLASYGVAGAFLWCNRSVTGLWVLAAGAAANLLAIVANDGVMPATASALRRAGFEPLESGFENSTVVDGARLALLGDVFAVPERFPFANVFSIGDVLIVLGSVLTLHTLCGSRLVGRVGRAARVAPAG